MAALAIAMIAAVAATTALAIPKDSSITAKYANHAPPPQELAVIASEFDYAALGRLTTPIDTTAPPHLITFTAEHATSALATSASITENLHRDPGSTTGPPFTTDFALAITGGADPHGSYTGSS